MAILNPPPQKIPMAFQQNRELSGFFSSLVKSIFTIFTAIGGKDGLPTIDLKTNRDSGGTAGYNEITGDTDAPTADPGWSTSSTVNMTPPDGYIKAYVGTQAVVLPYWNT